MQMETGKVLDGELLGYLLTASKHEASDIHLKPKSPPRMRINGELYEIETPEGHDPYLDAATTERMVRSTMRPAEWVDFETLWEKDYSIDLPHEEIRFRANAFYTRGEVGIVLRRINGRPPTLKSLKLPPSLSGHVDRLRDGLVLVTGATGSGKSTTLAAIVDRINETKSSHIITIEDPIEFIHADKKSSISQREVLSDTHDFDTALQSALRQDPDVILLGEMRSLETVQTALRAAETGHLVLSTLHTTSASETITRLLDFFAPEEQIKVRQVIAASLRLVVCQRLVPLKNESGRVPAVEILVNKGRIPEAISKPDSGDIQDIIKGGYQYGMQSFNDSLFDLASHNLISIENATKFSTNPHDLSVKMRSKGIV